MGGKCEIAHGGGVFAGDAHEGRGEAAEKHSGGGSTVQSERKRNRVTEEQPAKSSSEAVSVCFESGAQVGSRVKSPPQRKPCKHRESQTSEGKLVLVSGAKRL